MRKGWAQNVTETTALHTESEIHISNTTINHTFQRRTSQLWHWFIITSKLQHMIWQLRCCSSHIQTENTCVRLSHCSESELRTHYRKYSATAKVTSESLEVTEHQKEERRWERKWGVAFIPEPFRPNIPGRFASFRSELLVLLGLWYLRWKQGNLLRIRNWIRATKVIVVNLTHPMLRLQ